MPKKGSSTSKVRSAVTGQFVKKSEAEKHPKTTVTETIRTGKPVGKRKAK